MQKRLASVAAALLGAGAVGAGVIIPTTAPAYRAERPQSQYGFHDQPGILSLELALRADSPAVVGEPSRPKEPNQDGRRRGESPGRAFRTKPLTVSWLVVGPAIALLLQKSIDPAGSRSPPESAY